MLRYEQNQHYDSHYDSFAEEDYGPQFSQRVGAWRRQGKGRAWVGRGALGCMDGQRMGGWVECAAEPAGRQRNVCGA